MPDIDAAVAWYRDILGCYVLMEPIEGYADDSYFGQIVADIFGADFKGMKIAHLATADGVGIELFQFVANAPQEEHFAYWKTGIYHICILEPDIEGLAKRIDESGGRQRSKVWKLWPDKPTRSAIAKTPGAPSSRSAPTPTSWPGPTSSRRMGSEGRRRADTTDSLRAAPAIYSATGISPPAPQSPRRARR